MKIRIEPVNRVSRVECISPRVEEVIRPTRGIFPFRLSGETPASFLTKSTRLNPTDSFARLIPRGKIAALYREACFISKLLIGHFENIDEEKGQTLPPTCAIVSHVEASSRNQRHLNSVDSLIDWLPVLIVQDWCPTWETGAGRNSWNG